MTYQVLWHFSFRDNSICDILIWVIFQFWWNFSFAHNSLLVTFQFSSGLVWSGLVWCGVVTWESSKARVTFLWSQRFKYPTNRPTNYAIIVPLQIFFGLLGLSGIWRSAISGLLVINHNTLLVSALGNIIWGFQGYLFFF